MKQAFITGITGQDGAYLARFLLDQGYAVHGGLRPNAQTTTHRLDALDVARHVTLHDFDLTEPMSILRVFREHHFDEVYNLAAQSFVGASWNVPHVTSDINAMGALRLLDVLRTLAPETRYYQASTSEMFGLVQEVPQRETTRLYPRSPYGVSKAYAHHTTINYRESFDMFACSGILFNHESPLRGPQFVTRKITLALAAIARGEAAPLRLGNLDAQRDWGFAGDYIKGIWQMLQQDKADDYVLATGVTTTIRDFVRFAAEALEMDLTFEGEGMKEVALDAKTGATVVEVDSAYFRPAEVDLLIGDASKAEAELGWVPEVSVAQLAQMMARSDYDATRG